MKTIMEIIDSLERVRQMRNKKSAGYAFLKQNDLHVEIIPIGVLSEILDIIEKRCNETLQKLEAELKEL